jgi:hypothetical protein
VLELAHIPFSACVAFSIPAAARFYCASLANKGFLEMQLGRAMIRLRTSLKGRRLVAGLLASQVHSWGFRGEAEQVGKSIHDSQIPSVSGSLIFAFRLCFKEFCSVAAVG